MEKTKQNNSLILFVAIALVCVVAVVLLVAQSDKKSKETANQFASCRILSDSCKDESCKYLFLCNATEFSDCQVYDCGDKYGVSILDKQGNTKNEFEQKPDPEEVAEIVSKCEGSFEVIEKNNCVDGRAEAKIKVTTDGDCKILSSIVSINGKARIAEFEKDGEFYNLSVKKCGEISNIKVTGESGVAIREKVEISEEEMMHGDIMEERMLMEGFDGREM